LEEEEEERENCNWERTRQRKGRREEWWILHSEMEFSSDFLSKNWNLGVLFLCFVLDADAMISSLLRVVCSGSQRGPQHQPPVCWI